MLVSILARQSVIAFVRYLNGNSSLMIFDRHKNMEYKYYSQTLWYIGYYGDTVGRNKKII